MTPEERAERTARMRAEWQARGLPTVIENPVVYRLLAAIWEANKRKDDAA